MNRTIEKEEIKSRINVSQLKLKYSLILFLFCLCLPSLDIGSKIGMGYGLFWLLFGWIGVFAAPAWLGNITLFFSWYYIYKGKTDLGLRLAKISLVLMLTALVLVWGKNPLDIFHLGYIVWLLSVIVLFVPIYKRSYQVVLAILALVVIYYVYRFFAYEIVNYK